MLEGLPEVSIDRDKQTGSDWTVRRTPPAQEVHAKVTGRVQATLFRDFLFLLRLSQRHEELKSATQEVAQLLSSQSTTTIGRATRNEGGVRELARIDKALVKHVLLRAPRTKNWAITEYLPRDWLHPFANHLNELSTRIILAEHHWEHVPAIAYAVDGRVQQFTHVDDADADEQTTIDKKLAADAKWAPETELDLEVEGEKIMLTPSLKVALPTPDDPECCTYRDFSKGISELVYRPSMISTLWDVALMEGREKYYAVHAQASEGFGAQSLRTDPGFMGMLNHGSLGAVRLMGVMRQ